MYKENINGYTIGIIEEKQLNGYTLYISKMQYGIDVKLYQRIYVHFDDALKALKIKAKALEKVA